MTPRTSELLLNGPVTDGGVSLELFRVQGEGVEWSPEGKWVAYDCKHTDGYYNVHVCRPDGTKDRCLTTLDNGSPHRHAGTPSWHASGKYIAFAAEKKVHTGSSIEAIPGFGGPFRHLGDDLRWLEGMAAYSYGRRQKPWRDHPDDKHKRWDAS